MPVLEQNLEDSEELATYSQRKSLKESGGQVNNMKIYILSAVERTLGSGNFILVFSWLFFSSV